MKATNIIYSAELMQNFKQANIMAPEAQFEAVQTQEGHSLFFSIGTDAVFYLTKEVIGSETGYKKIDLSSVLKEKHPNAEITAKNFSVIQNTVTGKIDIMLVLNVGDNDHIYTALNNENTAENVFKNLSWTAIPFDDSHHSYSSIQVSEVYIRQTGKKQYIVVDILKNPEDANNFIFRYYLDPLKKINGSSSWIPHDLPANLHYGSVFSCLGRKSEERVDGIYTLGTINGKKELLYSPLYNPFDHSLPPVTSRLKTPKKISAIASVSIDNKHTKLFAAADKALYYYPENQQKDGDSGQLIMQNDLFLDVEKLYAIFRKNNIVIWGLNRAKQVFYTSCPVTEIENQTAWSYPLPILSGVLKISPYINAKNQDNTFFAQIGNTSLKKAVQSSENSLWNYENITLPALKSEKALKFNSYTTKIQLINENETPIITKNKDGKGVELMLSASTRSSVYINNKYYVLDIQPISVSTDIMGSLSIVEEVNNLYATCYKIHNTDGTVIDINPMESPQNKLAQIDSIDKLENAQIKNNDGSSKPLVSNSVSKEDKGQVVDALKKLNKISKTLPTSGFPRVFSKRTLQTTNWSQIPITQVHSFNFSNESAISSELLLNKTVEGELYNDFSNAIAIAAGDVFSFLHNVGKDIAQFFIVTTESISHFIIRIGNELYRFVLESAATVMRTIEIVFKAIKTFVLDVIDFLRHIFEWEDIIRTRDVFKKFILIHLRDTVDRIEGLKENIANFMNNLKSFIDEWAEIDVDTWQRQDFKSVDFTTVAPKTDTSITSNATASFLQEHFKNNIAYYKDLNPEIFPKPPKLVIDLINNVTSVFINQGNIFVDAIYRIKTEILDKNVTTMPLSDVLKKLLAIVTDAILNTTENIIDLFIDIFVSFARSVIDALSAPIYIPVLSDILEDVFHIKIEFSMLDVICLIGAVPATVAYKAATNKAPYDKDNAFIKALLQSNTVAELQGKLSVRNKLLTSEKQANSLIPFEIPNAVKETTFITGHLISGIVGYMSAWLNGCEHFVTEGLGPLEKPIGICSLVKAGTAGISSILANPMPIKNDVMSLMSAGCTGLTILNKVVFKVSPLAKSINGMGTEFASLQSGLKIVEGGIDAVISVADIIPIGYHFYEIFNEPPSANRTLATTINAVKICDDLATITGFVVLVDPEPISKTILTAIMVELITISATAEVTIAIIDAVNLKNEET